jgi:hypothetical protein
MITTTRNSFDERRESKDENTIRMGCFGVGGHKDSKYRWGWGEYIGSIRVRVLRFLIFPNLKKLWYVLGL